MSSGQLTLQEMLYGLIIVVIAFGVYKILTSMIRKASKQAELKPELAEGLCRGIKFLVVVVTVIVLLDYFGVNVTALIAGLGLGALAVGIAARDLITNWISGLFLIFERVYRVGDIIQVGTLSGRVVRIGIRATQIQTTDGNIVTVPNSLLASSQLINLTSGKKTITLTISQTIDYDTDLEKAKKLMTEVAKETPRIIFDEKNPPTFIVQRDKEWGVTLTMYVTAKVDGWHLTQSNLTEAIKKKFDEAKITPPLSALVKSQQIIEERRKLQSS